MNIQHLLELLKDPKDRQLILDAVIHAREFNIDMDLSFTDNLIKSFHLTIFPAWTKRDNKIELSYLLKK